LTQKLIDLTLTFADGKRGVSFDRELTLAEDGFNTTTLHIYSHALTHMDSPKHFLEDGYTMEQMNLEKCMGMAEVIDLSHKAPDSLILVEDVISHAERIHEGTRLLLRTDWDSHADIEDYRNQFPRISPELAEWLVERGISLLGVETPSVASLAQENYEELRDVHRTLLSADVVIIESLCNLRLLPEQVTFIAFPLKLEDCDGSPVRAVALVSEEENK